MLLGVLNPSAGEVRYQGRDVHDLQKEERQQFRKDVQAIFQDPFEVYNPFYKIDHILTTPVRKFGLATSKADAYDKIREALRAVGLRPEETLGRYPHQLSGGQRQRITIARALLLKPKLIIADEPVSMVDASLRATILSTLHALYRDFGISFIYITHDLTTAYQVSENIVILFHGAVAEAGHTEKVIKDPQHPYTRELIHSIPVPEPGREWIDEAVEEKEVVDIEDIEAEEMATGCRYVLRCPQAMAQCATAPPFYRPEAERAVACFLHAESPVLESGDLNEVFSASADAQK
ncbi:MAG: ABC transporter ATP-binding protein [Candidatus Latescibacteria bacterium]|nr:ABC transporter ATP-binding protein [Candidatus Latescibacterota bacterium]